jgi:hypothetical protein
MKPFFITGANCKIKLNNKTVAFATDLSYSIQIITQTPKILGLYEGSSVEPLGYSVSGSFTVIRYVKNAASNIASVPDHVSNKGNGIGSFKSNFKDGTNDIQLNPADLSNGSTFDLVVYQKTSDGVLGVANIKNARIVQADFSLSKKGLAQQRFSFVALYADEDSFQSQISGTHQFT